MDKSNIINELIVKDMGKFGQYQTTTKYNRNVCLSFSVIRTSWWRHPMETF